MNFGMNKVLSAYVIIYKKQINNMWIFMEL